MIQIYKSIVCCVGLVCFLLFLSILVVFGMELGMYLQDNPHNNLHNEIDCSKCYSLNTTHYKTHYWCCPKYDPDVKYKRYGPDCEFLNNSSCIYYKNKWMNKDESDKKKSFDTIRNLSIAASISLFFTLLGCISFFAIKRQLENQYIYIEQI